MSGREKATVLIAGGGVAALEAALALRDLAADRVTVELLAPEPSFWYRPLAVATAFEQGEPQHFELDGLARELGATFTLGSLVGVDAWRHIAHTSLNTELSYDALLIACGALPFPALPGAITFRGPADIEKIESLLDELGHGDVRSLAFAIPWGAVWSLPAYELALLTATHLDEHSIRGVELTLVTPEEEPLQVFGPPASAAIRELFDQRGVVLRTGAFAVEAMEGELHVLRSDSVPADRVVALPRLRGAPIDGIPQTLDGFVPVDAHCKVLGVEDVFAAGDITSFTVKQGGLATQQADAAASAIAAFVGADVTPERFRPVLRGLLLTGRQPRYFRREITAMPEREPVASFDSLWWPPAKIVGHHLAPFLAARTGSSSPPELPLASEEAMTIERELEPSVLADLDSSRYPAIVVDGEDGTMAEEVMSRTPLVVAPEDTLGEVAERMLDRSERVALVCEYGRLVGILTTSDLLRAAAARTHPSEARARLWMTAEPITVHPRTPLPFAETVMREYAIDQLPVVEGDKLIGLLRLEDAESSARVHVGLGF